MRIECLAVNGSDAPAEWLFFFRLHEWRISWANYLMRNNFVEHVNSITGNTFVEYQRGGGFMGVAFGAKCAS